MLRDGDCFGPVVNLAARGAFACVPLAPARIKGFEGETELFELRGEQLDPSGR
jgi:class 3 adenylate cyclase